MHLGAIMDIGLVSFNRKMHDAVADHGGKGRLLLRRCLAPSGRVKAQYLATVHRVS
jgi:hypothetical protein